MRSEERVHTDEFWEQKNQTNSFPIDEMRSENGSTAKYSLRKSNRPVCQRKS